MDPFLWQKDRGSCQAIVGSFLDSLAYDLILHPCPTPPSKEVIHYPCSWYRTASLARLHLDSLRFAKLSM